MTELGLLGLSGIGSRRSTGEPSRDHWSRSRAHQASIGPKAQTRQVLAEHFGRHPAVDIYLGRPGLGTVLAAWVLGDFDAGAGRLSHCFLLKFMM